MIGRLVDAPVSDDQVLAFRNQLVDESCDLRNGDVLYGAMLGDIVVRPGQIVILEREMSGLRNYTAAVVTGAKPLAYRLIGKAARAEIKVLAVIFMSLRAR